MCIYCTYVSVCKSVFFLFKENVERDSSDKGDHDMTGESDGNADESFPLPESKMTVKEWRAWELKERKKVLTQVPSEKCENCELCTCPCTCEFKRSPAQKAVLEVAGKNNISANNKQDTLFL